MAWAQQGQLLPDELVWQAQLPAWTPAGRLPGLFPAQTAAPGAAWSAPSPYGPPAGAAPYGAPGAAAWGAPGYSQAPPRASHAGRWALLSAVGLLVVAGAVVGALFGFGVLGGGAPLVETPMQAATVIDVPYESEQYEVPAEGGEILYQDAVIDFPKGAVDSDTVVEVKLLTQAFHMDGEASDDDAPGAVCIGPAIDLGPEGEAFDEPVTVTLPYDEDRLPRGVTEDQIVAVYWNGQDWVAAGGRLDTEKNTVSVRLREFAGITWTSAAPEDPDGEDPADGEPIALDTPDGGYAWTPEDAETTEVDDETETTDETDETDETETTEDTDETETTDETAVVGGSTSGGSTGGGSTGGQGAPLGLYGVYKAQFSGAMGSWDLTLDFGEGLEYPEGGEANELLIRTGSETELQVPVWVQSDGSLLVGTDSLLGWMAMLYGQEPWWPHYFTCRPSADGSRLDDCLLYVATDDFMDWTEEATFTATRVER